MVPSVATAAGQYYRQDRDREVRREIREGMREMRREVRREIRNRW